MHEGGLERGNTTWGWVVTLIYFDKELFKTEHKCNGMEFSI